MTGLSKLGGTSSVDLSILEYDVWAQMGRGSESDQSGLNLMIMIIGGGKGYHNGGQKKL